MTRRTNAIYLRLPIWFIRNVLLPFVATRGALTLIAWLVFRLIPLPSAFPASWEIGPDRAVRSTSQGAPATHAFINMWSRWDSGWYLEIAKAGYHYDAGKPSSAAFFPLYPFALRLLHKVLLLDSSDSSYLAAALLLSNLCLLAGLSYFRALVCLDYSDRIAALAVLCLLSFPTSFFLSSAYSESMFLGLGVSSFYYARKQRWLVACTLAGLAALSRSQGIILLVPLLVEYLEQKRWNLHLIRWDFAGLLLIPTAVFIWTLYLRCAFGSWSILFDAQKPWGRRFLAPWHTLPWVAQHASAIAGVKNDWLDLAFFTLLLIVSLLSRRRLRISYTAYLWIAVVFFSCWGMLGSVSRFLLGIFPLFICLALLCERHRTTRLAFFILSSVISALLFVMYSQWQWVA